tara:strand:+ start:18 stop:362 length:345 start_codon:yes stop_codon:yes gene_type:complete
MEKLSYKEILSKIDSLRSQGVEDTDPRIKKLKEKLWLILNERKKNKENKIIPKVTAIKTVKFKPDKKIDKHAIQKYSKNLSEAEEDSGSYTKYLLLGAAIAVAGLVYKFFSSED